MKRDFLAKFIPGLVLSLAIIFGAHTISAQKKSEKTKPTPAKEKTQGAVQNPAKPNNSPKPNQSPSRETSTGDQNNAEREQSGTTAPNREGNPSPSPSPTKPVDPETETSKFWDSFLYILLWVGGAIFVLLLLGGIGYLIGRFVNGVNTRIGNLQTEVSSLKSSVKNLKTKNQELYKDLKNLAWQFQGQAGEISNLKRQEGNFQSKQPEYQKSSPMMNTASGFTPEPDFPISVENYLNNNGQNGIVAKFDYKTNLLVEDASGEGALVIVRDNEIPGGLLYVVPRFGLFQTKDDFYTHLERYYDCQNPRGGTVWIKEPSVVEKDGNGWILRDKGEIEVR